MFAAEVSREVARRRLVDDLLAMVAERERACDEAVVVLGGRPKAYAEGLLKAYRFCMEAPLALVSGITGADLNNRIRSIMTAQLETISLKKKLILVVLRFAAVVGPIAFGKSFAQTAGASKRLEFEVASIRLSKPGGRGGPKPADGGACYTAHLIPVRLMISAMYRVPLRQVQGGPSWLDSDVYDVTAKAAKKYNVEELHTMFQNMLADRFKLQFHKVEKEGNAYVLTVNKGGPKMKGNDSPDNYKISINSTGNGTFTAVRESMSHFSWFLGMQLQEDQRPVVNMTGLTGNYDFTLTFLPTAIKGDPGAKLPPDLQFARLFSMLCGISLG